VRKASPVKPAAAKLPLPKTPRLLRVPEHRVTLEKMVPAKKGKGNG